MNIDFEKSGGLVPAIVQDALTMQVLMLGYMNREALDKTIAEGKVTFFSRSKQRLWTKGEESGHFLFVDEILTDCDNDTILVKAFPQGPTCHTGSYSCFGNKLPKGFLYELENIIEQRIADKPENSYTSNLFSRGVNKVAQKVGEEAVELVIEAKDDNLVLFKNEAADLLYHFLILLKTKNLKLQDIEEVLVERHK
ncbi:MAG TPA: bifunctional phosphoribosyl-AMP cyclohydrolase/phosphoribosyl-ATP diphosphatase HisIE [Dysgonamonadaceae bacterium]|jgi:phosphoribosyl-ATP pyrophosphohydrolase/phosphoribosyl-AMP cyclohydrolase|nr:bifunctional phosphoribosyl-AMP cyclohydrolase/phosphoribosyl-ATP diphosphatase HisIE [Dysgonamonadaceae bacterium]HPD42864.1 bifunctional phosphoribosyl-AMP cyclohydrolase/phosphoribosyl-ATP diphosphatase HisIE [Dysgonamonadaceae bacterium]HRS40998.1 bifunctional phosphoribosyl-AMP cyclohydrolase/phosphoribosyl-ATP diphosphatase HisIE [Dysgonamonadaceae bacterium]HRU12256.1 bifunctional phosphoribosyl-AMP cyclohydrolase/phosphoribosyl-ATP diphosphatase HisIE [Dysgonamonadaceae bacterium]